MMLRNNKTVAILVVFASTIFFQLFFTAYVHAQIIYEYGTISSSQGIALRIYKRDCTFNSSAGQRTCEDIDTFTYEGETSSGSRRFVRIDGAQSIIVNDGSPVSGTLTATGSSGTDSITIFQENIYEEFNFADSSGAPTSGGGSGSGGGGSPTGGGTATGGSGGAGGRAPGGNEDIGTIGDEVTADCVSNNLDESNCGIVKWINILINALTAVFGIIAIIMIAVGGVQYSFARDNPQQTAAAKERIRNVIIAIVAYVFLYGFMQYIIPGGI
jgi:hypothetical protein